MTEHRSSEEVLEYTRDMLRQLKSMSGKHIELNFLTYLLSVALEATKPRRSVVKNLTSEKELSI